MLDTILGFVGKGIDAFTSSSNTQDRIDADKALQAQNIAHQKEFAQHGIRWKVADAQAAGLHPLAALGAQTSSFSNVVGADIPIAKTNFGDMGQDIGRAIDAGSTSAERTDRLGQAVARTAQIFQLEKMNLENEQLKSSIALTRAQTPPPFPASALAHLSKTVNRNADGIAVQEDELKQKPGDIPETSSYRPFGLPLLTNRNFSDSQTVTNRLGEAEPLEWLTVLSNLMADLKYTAQQKAGMGKETNPFTHFRVPSKGQADRKPPRMFPYYR